MNERGFTLIETVIAMTLSISAATLLFVIPKRMLDANESYRNEVNKNLSHSTITLYINSDLSQGEQPLLTENGFTIGDVEYQINKGKLERKDNGPVIPLGDTDVTIQSDGKYVLIKDKENTSGTEELNIKIPLQSKYYRGGLLNE